MGGDIGGNSPCALAFVPLVAPRRNVCFYKVPSGRHFRHFGRHFIHSQRFPSPPVPWPLPHVAPPKLQIPGAAHV